LAPQRTILGYAGEIRISVAADCSLPLEPEALIEDVERELRRRRRRGDSAQPRKSRYAGFWLSSIHGYPTVSRKRLNSDISARGTCMPTSTRP